MNMTRRNFLWLTGAAAGAALASGSTAVTAATEESQMFIRRDWVHRRNQNRSTVAGQRGMVCTSQPLATVAGLDVLKGGGNAIDAAIAANAVLAVVEPMNCGPGGDLFAILWSARDGQLHGLNASGRSPRTWSLEAAQALGLERIPGQSPLAWNVPGCVRGWMDLLERFGTLSLGAALEAAAYYAREGFPVSPIVADDWGFDAEDHPTLAEAFGAERAFGEIMHNPGLAWTFEQLARDGGDAFYRGEIAERIVAYSQEHGGHIEAADLAEHHSDWTPPVSTNYRGYDVWELPPNGQGIAVLQMLNMLECFDMGAFEPNSPEHLHHLIEAKKLAFEDRAIYYADMDKAEVPLDWLISKDYGRERAALINPDRAADEVRPGLIAGGNDTVYLTTADEEGNMVSLIQSIYGRWGSRIVPGNLGFSMQNRGESFALDPAHRNRLEPRKRPFHTIIPAFVTRDGQPAFSFGVMGGDFQPQGHVQILLNMLDYGMSPQQAGDQPRIEHSGSSTQTGYRMVGSGRVGFERNMPDAVKVRLAELGHTLRPGIGAFGGYQGIWREEAPQRYYGASDPRKDGCAIGY